MEAHFAQDPSANAALHELELTRKYIARMNIQGIACIALAVLIFIAGNSFSGIEIAVVLGLCTLIPGIVFLSRAGSKSAAYKSGFKQKVIGAALTRMDSSLIMQPDQGIPEHEFVNSRLFITEPDRYSAEDLVMGKAGKTGFYFSEVHAEYKTEVSTKNGTRTEWHDILSGIVFCADFNKDFRGITVVRPQDIGSKLGGWFSKHVFSFGSNDVVELENEAFSKLFITHSTDQVEARYILTPALMERICKLNELCTYTVSLSFIDSRMYIAFPLDRNYFEPPVFSSLLKTGILDKDLKVLHFLYNIVEDLDLNTRIWTKQ